MQDVHHESVVGQEEIRWCGMTIEVPGSALATQQEVARQMMRVGESLALLDRLALRLREEDELDVSGLSVRLLNSFICMLCRRSSFPNRQRFAFWVLED